MSQPKATDMTCGNPMGPVVLSMCMALLCVIVGFVLAMGITEPQDVQPPMPQKVIITFDVGDLPDLGTDPFSPAPLMEVDPFATPTPACGTRQHMDSLQSPPAPPVAPQWSDEVVPDSIKVDPFPPNKSRPLYRA